ncbi:MAG: hypothetical protein ACR2I8_02665 [Steroidobacteraceae bacterium]
MNRILKLALGLSLGVVAAAAMAQEPVENVSPVIHPNIAAAQALVDQAYNSVVEAQAANNMYLGGHAERAKELLRQATEELKLAAETANAL